ncbi:LysR family transcriptional regulator [Sphaerisporangium sp. NPDC051011]|uniref:LysR family transcriptional regulator n=1 Tax=Sphaerisporangium sp. NPDC051011 TaxID=3155792 RepID=UPI0033E28FF5
MDASAVDSRLLRYFVAVAEELNFTRAAERLHIATPPLSRAIRKLEAELGVSLFHRTTHTVALTPAGEVLLKGARVALDALEAAVRRAQRTADPRLVLTVKTDNDAGLLEAILSRYASYASSTKAPPVHVRLSGWREQARLVRRGEADAALLYEPFDTTGLDHETITVDPCVVALPAAHPLASQPAVTLGELDLPGVEAGRPETFHKYLDTIAHEHRLQDLTQLLKRVELGELITLLPASVASHYPRPGIAYRPVPDAPSARLAIAWPKESRSPAIAALVRAATTSARATSTAAEQPPA